MPLSSKEVLHDQGVFDLADETQFDPEEIKCLEEYVSTKTKGLGDEGFPEEVNKIKISVPGNSKKSRWVKKPVTDFFRWFKGVVVVTEEDDRPFYERGAETLRKMLKSEKDKGALVSPKTEVLCVNGKGKPVISRRTLKDLFGNDKGQFRDVMNDHGFFLNGDDLVDWFNKNGLANTDQWDGSVYLVEGDNPDKQGIRNVLHSKGAFQIVFHEDAKENPIDVDASKKEIEALREYLKLVSSKDIGDTDGGEEKVSGSDNPVTFRLSNPDGKWIIKGLDFFSTYFPEPEPEIIWPEGIVELSRDNNGAFEKGRDALRKKIADMMPQNHDDPLKYPVECVDVDTDKPEVVDLSLADLLKDRNVQFGDILNENGFFETDTAFFEYCKEQDMKNTPDLWKKPLFITKLDPMSSGDLLHKNGYFNLVGTKTSDKEVGDANEVKMALEYLKDHSGSKIQIPQLNDGPGFRDHEYSVPEEFDYESVDALIAYYQGQNMKGTELWNGKQTVKGLDGPVVVGDILNENGYFNFDAEDSKDGNDQVKKALKYLTSDPNLQIRIPRVGDVGFLDFTFPEDTEITSEPEPVTEPVIEPVPEPDFDFKSDAFLIAHYRRQHMKGTQLWND
eukprot:45375_1